VKLRNTSNTYRSRMVKETIESDPALELEEEVT
jgi:hypothetical protein